MDALIVGAHLCRAEEALYRGIKRPTSHVVNQHAVSWIVEWWQKVTRTLILAHPCIFCGEREEDTGHMRILCERDKAVARLLCAKVEEFTADLRLADKAMEFLS